MLTHHSNANTERGNSYSCIEREREGVLYSREIGQLTLLHHWAGLLSIFAGVCDITPVVHCTVLSNSANALMLTGHKFSNNYYTVYA